MDASSANDPFEQLAQLVRRERGALLAAATREGLTPEDALECVQDALCTWLVRLQRPSLEPHPAAAAALLLTVRNAARNRRRLHRVLKPHAAIDADHELATREQNAEQLLSHAETSLRLQTCVAELREVERAVVTLRLLEERSGEDVAASLGISRAHVDVLVHRAKSTLRVCMRAPHCSEA